MSVPRQCPGATAAGAPSQLAHGASKRLTIQCMLSHWYALADDDTAALSAAPILLALQINRYSFGDCGPTKDEACIYPDPRFFFPVISGALSWG